jgi:hypothetical protein
MTTEVAGDGGEQEAGHYRIGYAVEEAEGMYEWVDGGLVWRERARATSTSRSQCATPATVASCPGSGCARRS